MGTESLNYHIDRFKSAEYPHLVDEIAVYEFKDNRPVYLSPGAYFEIIFQFGDFYQTLPGSTNWRKRPKAFIGGLHCQPFAIGSQENGNSLVSIKIEAENARNFIPGHLNAYKNRVVDLTTIFGQEKLRGIEQLLKSEDVEEKVAGTESFLKQIVNHKSASPVVEAMQEIKANMGLIPLDQIAGQVKLGASHFRKRFNEEIGLSPKEFSRITRINAICDYLLEQNQVSLTEVAYAFNYFDQSHFTKDFKSVKGMTPKQF